MKNKQPIFITALVVLGLVAAFLGYQLNTTSKNNSDLQTEVLSLDHERTDLLNLMKTSGFGDLTEDDVKASLENLLVEFEGIEKHNGKLNDSITDQKERIKVLLDELSSSQRKSKRNWRELVKYKAETNTLRTVMKDYVRRLDSLNGVNQQLQADIVVKDSTISLVSGERDQFQAERNDLSQQVTLGKRLKLSNLNSHAIRFKMIGGAETDTDKAKKAEQLKSCFTVIANDIADAGSKTFYLRVVEPNGNVLSPNGKTIEVDGKKLKITELRTIDYRKNNVDLCIYAKKTADKMTEGTYQVEVYGDGYLMQKTSLVLK